MNKIPTNIKYTIYGISALIFLLFGVEIISPFGINAPLEKLTGYFFGLNFNNLDYLGIASIPIFGMLFNSKRTEFKISELILDIFTILLSVLIIIGIGFYILTFIGKPSNPLIPEHLIIEPFFLYSTLTIGIGICIPFLFIKRPEEHDKINDNRAE